MDLGRLEEVADAERTRLTERLVHDCDRLRPGLSPAEVVRELLSDHPDDEGIYATARHLIGELSTFTTEHGLLPELGGTCRVGPAPPSRRYAVAMMSWTGAYEADAPAWFHVNLPDPSWDDETKERWRSLFSATTLPVITAHEVTPGHFAHGRMIRLTARGDVRRSLSSLAFVEGWAHYAEELLVDEGFRQDDPRFAIGVWIEALVRVTRLAAALGIHRGTMTVQDHGSALLRGCLPGGTCGSVRGEPGDVRPDLRPLHVGQARDPGASRRGDHTLGQTLQPPTVPRSNARARRTAAGNPGRRARTGISRTAVKLRALAHLRRCAHYHRRLSCLPTSPPMFRTSTRRTTRFTLSRR